MILLINNYRHTITTITTMPLPKKTKEERVYVVLEIARKLREFKGPNGEIENLYNDEFPAIKELKKVFNEYINQNDDQQNIIKLVSFSGSIKFPEIGRRIEYILPINKTAKSLFVLKS